MSTRNVGKRLELPPIYTIGYGSRDVQELVHLLKKYHIQYVIDVRSQPYSRYRPEFNREALDRYLTEQGMRYVYMGDLLGGRPEGSAYYTNGKVDYAKFWDSPSFHAGIERLNRARSMDLRVALLCSEAKPQDCHRSKMIGTSLVAGGTPVEHIDESGDLRSQEDVIALLTGGQVPFPEMELPVAVTTSRKRYRAATGTSRGGERSREGD